MVIMTDALNRRMNLQIALKILRRNQFALPSQCPQGRGGLCRGLVRTRKDGHETHEPLCTLCVARHTVLAGVSYLVVGVPVVAVVAAALAACVYEACFCSEPVRPLRSAATPDRSDSLVCCPASAEEREGGREAPNRPTHATLWLYSVQGRAGGALI